MQVKLEKLNINNEMLSVINIGIAGRKHAVKTVSGLIKEKGYKVGGTGIEEWSFSGLKEIDKKIYMFCPYMEGLLLDEVLHLPVAESLKYIQNLLDAMKLLEDRSMPLFEISTDSVFFDNSGNVIFFPSEILDKIRMFNPVKYRIDTYNAINHPDLSLKLNISFSIAALLYRIITGKFPFYSEDKEEIDSMIRMLKIIPPDVIIKGLSAEISFFITESLNAKTALSISKWKEKIDKWLLKENLEAIQEQKNVPDTEVLKGLIKKNSETFKTKLFWLKNWKTKAIQAASAIAVILIILYFVGNFFKPRLIKDFTPEKVVESFYLAANDLNHELMGDCVINNAGETFRNATIHLFIISKMQTAKSFGDSNIIPADEWAENGRPQISAASVLYGVVDFKIIDSEQVGGEEWQFTVQYEKWNSQNNEDESGGSLLIGEKIIEKVYLTVDREDWVIYKIELLESSVIN